MGRRGPQRKPTKLKVVEGNPGKRPINANEPDPEVKIPECPEFLDDVAKAEWNRIAPELEAYGLISELYRAVLAGYCNCYSRWVAAEKELKSGDLTFETEKGYVGQHPAVAIAHKATVMATMTDNLSLFFIVSPPYSMS